MLTVLAGICLSVSPTTTAYAGPKAHAKIGSISKDSEKNPAGSRIYLVTISTTQRGVQFFGTLNSAFEITDAQGQKYYGTDTFKQQSAYRQESEVEWRIEINLDGIEKPVISGYSMQYFAPDVTEPLDEKSSQCKTRQELVARNSTSKPLVVKGLSVALVGGKN